MNDKYKIFLTGLIPYLTICGGLWHYGYWSTFDINIFAYLDITDIVKSFISPLFATAALFILGHLISWFLMRKTFPYGGGADTRTGHFLNRFTNLIVFVWLTLVITFFLISDDPNRWLSAVWMILPTLSVPLTESGLLSDVIPDRTLRATILIIMTAIPLLSFATGKKESELIHRNQRFTTIDVETIRQIRATDSTTYKFLGVAGDFLFGVSVDNKTTLMIPKNGLRDIVTHKQK